VARRHPDCVPSETTSLAAGCDLLLKNWMTKVIKGNGEASIKIDVEVIGPGTVDPQGQALLSFDYQCDYRRFVHLEPVCKKLEKELPGASRQLLDTLDEVNYVSAQRSHVDGVTTAANGYAVGRSRQAVPLPGYF